MNLPLFLLPTLQVQHGLTGHEVSAGQIVWVALEKTKRIEKGQQDEQQQAVVDNAF